jgi:hypothetical protein
MSQTELLTVPDLGLRPDIVRQTEHEVTPLSEAELGAFADIVDNLGSLDEAAPGVVAEVESRGWEKDTGTADKGWRKK